MIPADRRAVALRLAALTLLAPACAPASRPGDPGPAGPRALLVSFDALSEARARATVLSEHIPTLLQFFDQASCAEGARPMFPSYTAASHAALWTGAYGNVNGIAGNSMVPLPWSEFSIRETRSGYDSRQLTAEPIWITAARSGLPAAAHHVTQAPGPPGRWLPGGGRDTALARRDSAALADPALLVLNGYDSVIEARLVTAEQYPARPALGWRNIGTLGGNRMPLREVSWAAGEDSLYALFIGSDGYREAVVSAERDVARGVRVRPAPVERDPPAGRALARHFSDVLWIELRGGRAGAYFRLFDLAPDLSSFRLLQSAIRAVASNHAAGLAEYQNAVGAFIGNGESALLRRGEFGPRIPEGGDGTAELRYLETAELSTRQFVRGSQWLWRRRAPALQVEYFPIVDEVDHLWYGFVSPEVPGFDSTVAARVNAMRSRGWALADRRLDELLALAREGGALLVLSGDHGMRPTWRFFHVNVALREAGLLAFEPGGRPDLTRTRAYSPTGYYIHVNRIERKDGIVPPDDRDRVADSAARVLLAARGPDGRALVPRVWRPAPDDTLGIGGPAGGELYFDLAPGYYYSNRVGDSLTTAMPEPGGSHGFPSIHADMRTVLCALGPGVGGRRFPTARVIDAAPTVTAWLGIPPPAEARGRSLLPAMESRNP